MAMIPNGQILPDSDRGAAITPQPPVINNNISCGCGGCGGGGGGTSDHEQLTNLLGGDSTGHYHLTKSEYEAVLKLIEEPVPEPKEWTEYDGGDAGTTDDEYDENKEHWLDGGFAEDDHDEEFNGGEAL